MSCRTIKTQKVPLGEPVKSCRGAKDMTGFSEWIWRRMALRGEIDSYRVGKQLFLPVREINRVVSEGYKPRVQAIAQHG